MVDRRSVKTETMSLGTYRERIIEAEGTITESIRASAVKRLQWEPFEEDDPDEGTPDD